MGEKVVNGINSKDFFLIFFLCFLGCFLLLFFVDGKYLEKFLEFVVEYQDEGTASSTENVGQSSLEESTGTFILGDLDPAIQCVLVHNVSLCASRLHHHSSSDSVEWI